MNLSVKEKTLLLGCFLLGFQAFSQSCPVPPAGVQQGQFTITPNGRPAVTIVGHGTGNTPLTLCPGIVPATITNTTVMAAGSTAFYYYPFNAANTANVPMPTTGGSRYPTTGALVNRFQIPVNTPGKYVIVQTTRNNAGAVLTYACKVVEVPVINTPVAEFTSCVARQVTVEIANNNINKTFDSFEITWGDGTPITTFANNKTDPTRKETHTYANNNTYLVTLRGKIAGQSCELPLSRSVSLNGSGSTITAQPRITSLTVMSETEIQMGYLSQNNTFEFYQKKLPATAWTKVGEGSLGAATQTKSFDITNGSTDQYCYKIRQKNACGTLSASSDSICSLPTNGSIGGNKFALVKWKPIPFTGFNIQQVVGVAGTGVSAGRSSAALNATTNEYKDTTAKTCLTYGYQVRAIKATNGMTSISLLTNIEVKDETKPATIANAFLTVNDNKVELRPTYPATASTPIKQVVFLRANSSSPPHSVNTPTTSQNISDPTSEPDKQQQCYKIVYKNNCLVESDPSEEFCAVYLKPTADGIVWTDYKKFATGIERYEIEKRGTGGFTLLKRVSATTFDYKPDPSEIDPTNGEVRYRIKVIAKTTNQASYSNEVVFAPKATLFIPEAFTPNNDTKNDRFDIYGYFIKEFSMKIYNRWGIVVFETDKYGKDKGWDGKIGNDLAPLGTYVYEYIVTDYKEQTEKKKGYLFLLQ
jgi:gliding motility-associated-like protein